MQRRSVLLAFNDREAWWQWLYLRFADCRRHTEHSVVWFGTNNIPSTYKPHPAESSVNLHHEVDSITGRERATVE